MNLDIALSASGDLVLGQQATDKDGRLLYYLKQGGMMGNFGALPETTTDPSGGGLPVRDLNYVRGEASELQLIKSRLQTDNPDWYFYKQVGADLSDLIGQPNSPSTANAGKAMILRALTYDKAFAEEDLRIEAVPVGPHQMLFDLQLKRRSNLVRYALVLDLTLGVTNVYEKD